MNDHELDCAIRATLDGARPSPGTCAAMDAAFATITQDAANGASSSRRRRRLPLAAKPWARAAAVACAVCLGVGGTAYAADALGLISLKPSAPHQVMLGIADDATGNGAEPVPDTVDHYRLKLAYEPAGLTRDPDRTAAGAPADGRCADFYSDDFLQSLRVSVLYHDTDEAFPVSYVAASETVDVNGRASALITNGYGPDNRYLQLFIPFPDEHRVVVVGATANLRDEMLAVARGISLEPAGTVGREYLWLLSDFLTPAPSEDDAGDTASLQASHDQMAHLHQVGDTFALPNDDAALFDRDDEGTLEARVTDVKVADNLSALACDEVIPDEWRAVANADGTLGNAAISFRTCGDGVNSLDEVVATRSVPMALVQANIDYTNTGDTALDDVLFFIGLLSATEGPGGWQVFDRASQVPGSDEAVLGTALGTGEMYYYDVNGKKATDDPDAPNYIAHLEPGETATVSVAWLVPRDELGQLLLTLNSSGYCFDEEALQLGYVDIRQ